MSLGAAKVCTRGSRGRTRVGDGAPSATLSGVVRVKDNICEARDAHTMLSGFEGKGGFRV